MDSSSSVLNKDAAITLFEFVFARTLAALGVTEEQAEKHLTEEWLRERFEFMWDVFRSNPAITEASKSNPRAAAAAIKALELSAIDFMSFEYARLIGIPEGIARVVSYGASLCPDPAPSWRFTDRDGSTPCKHIGEFLRRQWSGSKTLSDTTPQQREALAKRCRELDQGE